MSPLYSVSPNAITGIAIFFYFHGLISRLSEPLMFMIVYRERGVSLCLCSRPATRRNLPSQGHDYYSLPGNVYLLGNESRALDD